MKIAELEHGKEYLHRYFGRVLLISSHPHDGALLIIERMSTTDRDDDGRELDDCEACDLSPAEGSEWPYLGFTSAARSAEVSRRWSAKHGFTQVPEGSGCWQYADGTPVPQRNWLAAWHKDFLTTQKETP